MKKKLIGRGLIGFPVGIAIGYVITVIISICIGDGFFHPVNPELVNKMGSELNAILIQTGLSGIMGTGFAMASVIWEIDSWSLAKQSGIYFAIACVIMFPISYFANWMPHSTAGILSYVGIFVAIFLAAWVAQYSVWKRKIKKMNEGIKDNNDKSMSKTENVELTVLCLIEDGDKILLQNRVKKDWRGYALPGGHVEPGESFVDAVIREMKEETGLTILNPRLVGVKQFPLENGRYVVLLF